MKYLQHTTEKKFENIIMIIITFCDTVRMFLLCPHFYGFQLHLKIYLLLHFQRNYTFLKEACNNSINIVEAFEGLVHSTQFLIAHIG